MYVDASDEAATSTTIARQKRIPRLSIRWPLIRMIALLFLVVNETIFEGKSLTTLNSKTSARVKYAKNQLVSEQND